MVEIKKSFFYPLHFTLWIWLFVVQTGSETLFGLTESAAEEGCNARAVHDLGWRGQGVNIGLISQQHCRVSHEAFFDKDADGNPIEDSHAYWYDPTGDTVIPYEPLAHDTTMAGILAGRGGKLYPEHVGMAPEAEVYSVKITRRKSSTDPNRITDSDWFESALDYLQSNQCRVVVTGVQMPVEYDTTYFPFTLLYDYYAYNHDMIFINAAGNDYPHITIFGTASNGITTGGLITTEADLYRRVGTASNPGPTTDGRRKPDVTAPAESLWVPTSASDTAWRTEGTTRGQTSWAGPHAAGVAALLVSFADSTAEPEDGRSEVIKAVIVNSAFPNILDKSGNATTGQVWNAHRGYGRIDALRAYKILCSPRVIPSTTIQQEKGWVCQTIKQNQEQVFSLHGLKNHRLVVTLTWHRKVTGSYTPESPPYNLAQVPQLL